MKLLLLISASIIASSVAFAPSPTVGSSLSSSRIYSEPKEEEEGGMDLDLGEMFEMFDAADKGEDFDKAVDKIKGSE
eukprot:CAMPEP_0194146652 /NCGR_PEP_ID=MMETSP0152-20130528/21210_1 /TAXON_ID=1049557 /ORGANISM="Thalassiothrix antarctica, Strain L6-D1" /LENGTH=76 /DNA_ID=CAMNT_0038847215 /DNA_START=55 /DNA_END=285 /DNA_ORIENTATION=+